MKISPVNKCFFYFLFFVLFINTTINGQAIAPIVSDFSKICAGSGFNQFKAVFNHSGFPAGTTFEVILSDPSGSFTNPVTTTTLSVADVSGKQTIDFAIPTNLVGSENYRLRVKSSTGFISGNFSVRDPNNVGGTLTYFPAYYKPFEGVYFINNKLPTATICLGGSVTLSVYNPTPNIPNSSPANYPDIKYKWRRGTSVIAGQTGPSLVVNSAGVYYVELDYGSCTDSNSRSNSVTVTQSSGGTSGIVSSSLGNPFCSEETTTLSAVTGNTYQWYKDNAKINGAIDATYLTNQAGLYSVDVDFGGCKSTYTIDLKDFKIESTINIPETSVIVNGQTKTVVVTTDAVNPTYEWYKSDILITDNQSNTYEVSSEGNYKVVITQNSACPITNEISFVVNTPSEVVNIPNLITPNNDGANDFWEIPQEYVNNNTKVQIINSNGETVFRTDNYLNNWPENSIDFKSINPVYYYIMIAQNGEVKKGSITIVK